MTYDPQQLWTELGSHIAGPGAGSPEHLRQAAALGTLLSRLEWSSVCEVGVGGGRIADLLHQVRPIAEYTGIDIGRTQLDRGRRVWPDGTFELTAIEDFHPERQWDLVLTCEVLMHVVPARIEDAVANVLRMARRHVVIVEWVPLPDETFPKGIAPWNFPHDYETLLGSVTYSERTDHQMIYHVEVAD